MAMVVGVAAIPVGLLMARIVATWGVDPPAGTPGYVLSREERFSPDAAEDYVAGTKRWIAAMRDREIGLSFAAFADADGNVEYNVPVARLADVGAVLRAWATAEGHLVGTDWGRVRQATLRWQKYSLWWQSPGLTYRPPSASPSPMPYFVWKNLRLRPDLEPAFLENARRIRAHLDDEPLDRALGVFRNVTGPEGPLYAIVIPGKDPAELAAWQETLWKTRRTKLQAEVGGLLETIVEVTEGRGWDRPDLSLAR